MSTSHSGFVSSLLEELRQDALLFWYILVTCLLFVVFLVLTKESTPMQFSLGTYLKTTTSVVYVSFLSWSAYFYMLMLVQRHPAPLKNYLLVLARNFKPWHQSAAFILIVLALNFTFSSYTFIKMMIPDLHPYHFDLLFYQWDKWLHFGRSPWEWTHLWFSHPLATWLINFFYHLWFILMWGSVVWVILRKSDRHLRAHFILSFMSAWLILGAILATLLSSAGPCYVERLNGDWQMYTSLMERLHNQYQYLLGLGWFPIWAIDVQDMLWDRYIDREQGIGVGISAMPSMHLSISVLLALLGGRINKKLGWVMWAYVLIIQIGSVHLAWHYAIDGYVSIVLTLLLWWLVGKWVDRHYSR